MPAAIRAPNQIKLISLKEGDGGILADKPLNLDKYDITLPDNTKMVSGYYSSSINQTTDLDSWIKGFRMAVNSQDLARNMFAKIGR